MTERRRELILVVLLIVAAAGGAALDAFAGDVEAPEDRPLVAGFVARAVFCPTPLAEDASAQLAVTAAGNQALPVAVEPGPAEAAELGAGRGLVSEMEPGPPVEVTGLGGAVVASVLEVAEVPVDKGDSVLGVGAGNCAGGPASHWYFPQGSSLLDFDQRLVVANPFPEEAVIKVLFLTPDGEQVPSGLAQVAVPAGETRTLRINEFARTQGQLSTIVESIRGRVMAWKGVTADPEGGSPGFTFTLGATSPSRTWLFPEGRASGATETISVMNPTAEEAAVTVSLATTEGLVQPPKLVDLPVAPKSSRSIEIQESLTSRQSQLGGVSAVLQSTNGVSVVAERTMAYQGADLGGLSSEIGVSAGALEWVVGPATPGPDSDSLVVMNTGPANVRLDVSLRSEKATLEPRALRDIKVPAGLRIAIPIDDFADEEAIFAHVTATGPVVVERVSYSALRGDVGSLMGQPQAPVGEEPQE